MIALQIIAVVLAIAGIVGSIVPALPGPPLGWLAMLCAFFCHGSNSSGEPMTLTSLLVWLGITIVITVLDYVIPAYMTKATGGHKAAERGAAIGLVLGLLFPPVGMILGSLLGAFIGEFAFANSDTATSLKAAAGTFAGFISGTVMKLAVSAAMAWQAITYIA